jgi:hypothetical protein
MKKENYEYDYKFDWILRKARNKELAPHPEDYKKKIMEKLDDSKKKKKRSKEDEEEA